MSDLICFFTTYQLKCQYQQNPYHVQVGRIHYYLGCHIQQTLEDGDEVKGDGR